MPESISIRIQEPENSNASPNSRNFSSETDALLPKSSRETKINSPKLRNHDRSKSLFQTVAWDQEETKEREERYNIYQQGGIKGFILKVIYATQGWIAVSCIGIVAALVASVIDVSAEWFNDIKMGVCTDAIWLAKARCCTGINEEHCTAWKSWPDLLLSSSDDPHGSGNDWYSVFFVGWIWYTLLAAVMIVYAAWLIKWLASFAAGSGIPEIKTILGGYSIKKVLGIWTFVVKSIALVLTIGSNVAVGKEGPMIHIACCIGNILSRLFPKYYYNEAKKREILSASCAVGVSVAFGAPVGGVLFSLEEASSYFPPKTLFRSFFCAIIGALFITLVNPKFTGKLAVFPLSYRKNWYFFELVPFALLGVIGGVLGTLFNLVNTEITRSIRKKTAIGKWQLTEVLVLSLLTSTLCYWNEFTRSSMAEMMAKLFDTNCSTAMADSGVVEYPYNQLCHLTNFSVMMKLVSGALIRLLLVTVTFGSKIPAGLFVPSMAIGSMFGFFVGSVVKDLQESYPASFLFTECRVGGETAVCVAPGTYAIMGAAALLTGITRITVSCVVILFEVTGSIELILPLMLCITIAKVVGDALEKESIYEMYIDMNGYPHLENKADIGHSNATAKDVMTCKELKVVYADCNSIERIRRLLQECNNWGFPVIQSKRNSNIVGYISKLSLALALESNKTRVNDSTQLMFCKQLGIDDVTTTTATPGTPTSSSSTAPENINRLDLSEYLDASPVQVQMSAGLERVYDLFRALGLKYLLVTRNGKLRGIITKKDVVTFLRATNGHGRKQKRRADAEEDRTATTTFAKTPEEECRAIN